MKRKSLQITGLENYFRSPKNRGDRYMEIWSEFRKNEMFSDCVLVSSDGVSYKTHRLLLASASPYFKVALLRSETNQLNIPFDSSVVESVIDFVYSGDVSISTENVEELLPAADHLCLVKLVDKCSEFLKAQITPHNAWRIYKYADFYSCKSLAAEAMAVIIKHFEEFVTEYDEFVEMSGDELKSLLLKDELNVKGEKVVLEAIDIWIKANITKKDIRVSSLLETVRWGFISKEYIKSWIEKVSYREFISPTLIEYLNTCSDYSRNLPYSTVAKNVALKPRIPHTLVFASGGWSTHITDRLWTYDVWADRWLKVEGTKLKIPMAYHGMVCVNNLIYLIGGFDGRKYLNNTLSFDPVTQTWNRKANMHFPRCYISVVVHNNEIYAIGGSSGQYRLRSVEKYNIDNNQWTLISSMHFRRSDAGALAHDDKIYVCGGCDGESVLASVEVYDCLTKRWMILEDMNSPRRGLSVCYFDDFIYALGGSDGMSVLDTNEKMCPSLPAWRTDVPLLNIARSNFSIAVVENKILVIGGFDGRKTIKKTEWFDGHSWSKGTSLRDRRSALAVCLVTGISNAHQYSFLSRISWQND